MLFTDGMGLGWKNYGNGSNAFEGFTANMFLHSTEILFGGVPVYIGTILNDISKTSNKWKYFSLAFIICFTSGLNFKISSEYDKWIDPYHKQQRWDDNFCRFHNFCHVAETFPLNNNTNFQVKSIPKKKTIKRGEGAVIL